MRILISAFGSKVGMMSERMRERMGNRTGDGVGKTIIHGNHQMGDCRCVRGSLWV